MEATILEVDKVFFLFPIEFPNTISQGPQVARQPQNDLLN